MTAERSLPSAATGKAAMMVSTAEPSIAFWSTARLSKFASTTKILFSRRSKRMNLVPSCWPLKLVPGGPWATSARNSISFSSLSLGISK